MARPAAASTASATSCLPRFGRPWVHPRSTAYDHPLGMRPSAVVVRTIVRFRPASLSMTARQWRTAVRTALDRGRSFDQVFVGRRDFGGRAGLPRLLSPLQDSIATVVQVERVLWPRWRRRGVDLVAGRARLRMARAVESFGFTPAVYDELFAAVLAAYRKVLAVHERRRFLAARRCVLTLGRSAHEVVVLQCRPPRAHDSGPFLRATIRRARAGREKVQRTRDKFVEANLLLVNMFAGRHYKRSRASRSRTSSRRAISASSVPSRSTTGAGAGFRRMPRGGSSRR